MSRHEKSRSNVTTVNLALADPHAFGTIQPLVNQFAVKNGRGEREEFRRDGRNVTGKINAGQKDAFQQAIDGHNQTHGGPSYVTVLGFGN